MRPSPLNRRDFLARATAGALVAGTSLQSRLALAAAENGGGPLAPRLGHFPPKAERLIFVFLTGGYSQVDTFDPKPQLTADDGKEFNGGFLLRSPFKFSPCGQSGLMLSELFPHLADVADELCVLRTLHTDIVEHFQATLAMHTGSATVPMPSLGTWVSYAPRDAQPELAVVHGSGRTSAVCRRAGVGQQLSTTASSGRAHHAGR